MLVKLHTVKSYLGILNPVFTDYENIKTYKAAIFDCRYHGKKGVYVPRFQWRDRECAMFQVMWVEKKRRISSYKVIFQFARARHHWSTDRTENVWARNSLLRRAHTRARRAAGRCIWKTRPLMTVKKKRRKKAFYPHRWRGTFVTWATVPSWGIARREFAILLDRQRYWSFFFLLLFLGFKPLSLVKERNGKARCSCFVYVATHHANDAKRHIRTRELFI